MKLHDTVKKRGRLRIVVRRRRDGKIENVIDEKNVIVNTGKRQMAHLVAGSGEDCYVTQMQFGTGSTPESESDVTLQSPITPVKPVTVSFPDLYKVTFQAFLMDDEAVGFTLCEAGLLTGSDVLVARKVHAGLDKDDEHIFEYNWTIEF